MQYDLAVNLFIKKKKHLSKLITLILQLDILFAQTDKTTISDDLDLKSNEILINMNIKSVKSLNGLRNTEEIFSLIPNKEQFRTTLRAIKLWAKSLCFYIRNLVFLKIV